MTLKHKPRSIAYTQGKLHEAARKAQHALNLHLHKGTVQSEFETELFMAYSDLKIAILAHEKLTKSIQQELEEIREVSC